MFLKDVGNVPTRSQCILSKVSFAGRSGCSRQGNTSKWVMSIPPLFTRFARPGVRRQNVSIYQLIVGTGDFEQRGRFSQCANELNGVRCTSQFLAGCSFVQWLSFRGFAVVSDLDKPCNCYPTDCISCSGTARNVLRESW